jgi:uncharacterized coiled-coil protein SlyX
VRSLSPRNARARSPESDGSLPIGRSPPSRSGSYDSRSPQRRAAAAGGRRRSRSISRDGRSTSPPYGRRGPSNLPPTAAVYVGNLPPDVTSVDIKAHFERFGPVKHVKLIYDHETQKFRGFGFVTFEYLEDARDAAAEGDGGELLGQRIRCNPARDNRGTGGPPPRGADMRCACRSLALQRGAVLAALHCLCCSAASISVCRSCTCLVMASLHLIVQASAPPITVVRWPICKPRSRGPQVAVARARLRGPPWQPRVGRSQPRQQPGPQAATGEHVRDCGRLVLWHNTSHRTSMYLSLAISMSVLVCCCAAFRCCSGHMSSSGARCRERERTGAGAGPSAAAPRAQLQAELDKLRKENGELGSRCAAAEATAEQMSQVIDTAKRKVDKQQAKLKTITMRSQKRCASPLLVTMAPSGVRCVAGEYRMQPTCAQLDQHQNQPCAESSATALAHCRNPQCCSARAGASAW